MKLVNFGSLNIDRVYHVSRFVRPGETILVDHFQFFAGGKGLNQSVAAARAGARVLHAGMVGKDGGILRRTLEESGVDTSGICEVEQATGHAVIQVSDSGQNCILVHGGANRCLTEAYIDRILDGCVSQDIVLVQNEINQVPYIIRQAKERGMRVAFNPSPIGAEIYEYPLEMVDWLILNELEGAQIAQTGDTDGHLILESLHEKFPDTGVVLTLGEQGVLYQDGRLKYKNKAYSVPAVDSTGAGDTFCGYFLACTLLGKSVQEGLRTASQAAAIAVSRMGASASIPMMAEVSAFQE